MRHIKNTKRFSDRVSITNGSLYGKYSNKHVAEHAARLTELTLRVLDHHLLIPDDTKYIISKISNSTTLGAFSPDVQQVMIDSRQQDDCLVRAICHESIHVDQVARGDLRWEYNKVIWQDRVYTDIHQYSLKQYLNTPWELEAYSRQDELATVALHAIFG